MKKYNVLVFPAGTEIAFEIHAALKFSKYINLFGANSIPSHAAYLFKQCVTDLPFCNDDGFVDALNKVIDQWNIDFVYPAHDSVCLTLTKNMDKLHAKVVTSPLKTVAICRSKKKIYEFFQGETFVPEFYNSIHDIPGYPVFVKPVIGQGSVGARIVGTETEVLNILKENKEYVICEYLPGEEYTVDCFTDRSGTLRACHARRRERIRTGIAVCSSLIPMDESILDIADRINAKLEFNGAWFFQLKKNSKGEYRLMEISARIPGTMGVSRNLGINYPLLTLCNMLERDIDIIDNGLDITLDRAFISRYRTNVHYSKVYMDCDETLNLGNKVNIQIIAFLYQCFNNRIPVILMIRHTENADEVFDKYRISGDLFDEIIQIEQGKEKCDYIDSQDCILIDDSFRERRRVKEKMGIPVYDLDMIESLIDWRM